MKFVTNVHFTIEGKPYLIPFIVEVDQNLKTYEQCIKATELSKELVVNHVPKKAKDVYYRMFEVGVASINLN